MMMREVEVLIPGMFQGVDPACFTEWGDLSDGKSIVPGTLSDNDAFYKRKECILLCTWNILCVVL